MERRQVSCTCSCSSSRGKWRADSNVLLSLQRHNRANQSPIFLQLHCWMHLILASAFLTGTNILRRSKHGAQNGAKSGAATPNSATANSLWRNSARTIGDILVLSDIINSHSYLALPFVNQAFYVAGCCYVKGTSYISQPILVAELSLTAQKSSSTSRHPRLLQVHPNAFRLVCR